MKRITCHMVNAYLALCRIYSWKPTWEGLRAFARGDRNNLLQKEKAPMMAATIHESTQKISY